MDAAEAKPANLGGSLPVPNVQDLAARIAAGRTPPAVLDRYLRDEQGGAALEPSSVVVNGDDDDAAAWAVPVVDLGRLLDPERAEEEAAKLRSACEDWGFFQVVNHGVPAEAVDGMKESLRAFFRLPLAEKRAFAQRPGEMEGYGQAFVVDQDQKLDYSDMYFLFTQPPEYRALEFWPPSNHPSAFRESLERYSVEVQRVATDLLRVMAKNLGLDDPSKLTRIAASQAVRMNYYPPCPAAAAQRSGSLIGLSPHSDAVGLTLLLQVGAAPGLQIRRRGRWVPVAPLPGALVANVGDVVEVLTNGRYRSVEHRAVVSAREERVSVAAFHVAKFGDMYGPMEEVMVEGEAPGYRTVSVEDYVRLVFSSKLDGKNIMDAMKIDHPAS